MQASVSSSLTWIVDAEATAFANELRMAQPLTASNCAKENTADVVSAKAAGIEIFPLNTSLNPKEANPWLFVRRQQREVWQAAFNASRDVVVTGSPGIGKSFSMSFLFRVPSCKQTTPLSSKHAGGIWCTCSSRAPTPTRSAA